VRRGNDEQSSYGIVDGEDWQGDNPCLARDPHEAEGALVRGMIQSSGMTVDRHQEGQEDQAAQQPDDSQGHHGKVA
jgi:hypothetical protein